MNLNFSMFNIGTLFLVRTPEVFPVGYADKCFKDMKENLHFDFVALLETWNCRDGVLWKTDKFPRSSYWINEERDPLEECFEAANKYDMAFLPECGMMDVGYMKSHEDGMCTSYDGKKSAYGRIGLTPSCPYTLEYLINKYDTLYQKFGHHKSFKGFCLPCESSAFVTYDKYTLSAWKEKYGCEMPSPAQMDVDRSLELKVVKFAEEKFLEMYRKLAKHLKEKYKLPLMQYPANKLSYNCYFQPTMVLPNDNLTIMNKVDELDLLNVQLHPPLNPNPYFFKMETEFMLANSIGKPCMADTHFYHEYGAGRLPDTTPKRIIDSVLSTITPNGISFFCYGFMAEELPLWKKELNPGAPVYNVYQESHTQAARREMALKAMDYTHKLRHLMENTHHYADCAIYYPESIDKLNVFASYPLDHIFGIHEALNAAAIPVKITASIPENPTQQKVLIMSSVKAISREDACRLNSYLKSGGKLVIIGKCCDEIEKIAGISVHESNALYVRNDESDFLFKDYHNCYIHLPDGGRHYSEQNGNAVLLYDDKTPAVTTLGNVIYIGMSDEIGRFGYYRDYFLASWLKEYFTAECMNSGVEYHNVYVNNPDNHQFVSCDIYENENKKLLFIRNFGIEQNDASVSWELPSDMKVSEAWYDGKKFEFVNGGRLPVFEHYVAVSANKI